MISESVQESKVINSSIISNKVMSLDQIEQEKTSCLHLCYLSEEYFNLMLKEVENIQDFSNAVFRFVIGRLFIVSSVIEDYEKLIYSYSSFI